MPGKVQIGQNRHKWAKSSSDDLISLHKVAGRTMVEGKSRRELANPEIARRAARTATTKAIHKGWVRPGEAPVLSADEAQNLKKGVEGMLARIDPTSSEFRNKIEAMDPEKLAQLYQNNKFVFEVYFNYGGIEKTKSGAMKSIPAKRSDAEFLISEYERAFGELAV